MTPPDKGEIIFDRNSEEVVRMLEALAGASAELEHVSRRLSDHLERVGSRLRNTLLNEIRLSRQRVNVYLTSYLTSATRDKNQVITELSQFRQKEIRAMLLVSRQAREQLAKEASNFISEYSDKVNTDLDGLKNTVANLKCDEQVELGRTNISSVSAKASLTINEQFGKHIRRLPELSRERLATVESAGASLKGTTEKSLSTLLSKFYDELDGLSRAVSTEINNKHFAEYQERFCDQQLYIDDYRKSFPERFQKSWEKEKIGEYFNDLLKSFEESLANVCQIQSGSYQAQLQNVAHQSKSDILTSTRNTCEEMKALQAEFIASTVEQQRVAWDKCDQLLTILERSIEAQVAADANVPERVRAALKNMAYEFRGKTAKKAHHMEMYFDRTAESVISQIESMRNDACEELENEVSVARRQISEIYDEIERRLADLQKQTIKIERSGMRVSGLITAIKKSSISFQEDGK